MPTRRAASCTPRTVGRREQRIHAPLTDVVLPTGTFSWYDLPDSVPGSGIDLLFVDGLRWPQARWPATRPCPSSGLAVTRRGHRHG